MKKQRKSIVVGVGDKPRLSTFYVRFVQAAPRVCLMCGRIFESLGPGNRRCPACEHNHMPHLADRHTHRAVFDRKRSIG